MLFRFIPMQGKLQNEQEKHSKFSFYAVLYAQDEAELVVEFP